jgi:hypothetical protein
VRQITANSIILLQWAVKHEIAAKHIWVVNEKKRVDNKIEILISFRKNNLNVIVLFYSRLLIKLVKYFASSFPYII